MRSLCIRNTRNCKHALLLISFSKQRITRTRTKVKTDLFAQEVILRARSTKSLAKTKFPKIVKISFPVTEDQTGAM